MEKVVPELDLLGLGLGGQKRIFPHTESSNSKAAESGNNGHEKANNPVWPVLGVHERY